jgi:hypothetical protein
MDRRGNNHSLHRIVLPSGRAIQVVRLDEPTAEHRRPLHVCPECTSQLVQPSSWTEVDDGHWELALLCPNCEWGGEGVYSLDEVEELEERLEQGHSEMLADLQRLAQANVADQIDRFVAALDANLILPEDF